jgi:hypothetical protein
VLLVMTHLSPQIEKKRLSNYTGLDHSPALHCRQSPPYPGATSLPIDAGAVANNNDGCCEFCLSIEHSG